jgi:hypothetical protein
MVCSASVMAVIELMSRMNTLESPEITQNHTTPLCSRTSSLSLMSSKCSRSYTYTASDRISPSNTHILNGNAEDLYKECEDYEDAIKSFGGIDLFLGGIGAGRSSSNMSSANLIARWTYRIQRAWIFSKIANPNQDSRIRDYPRQLPILQ